MKHRILVIEDEDEIRELMKLYLDKEGYETIQADSAERGLECIASGVVDLVLLDLNLPGCNGYEFLRRIRREKDLPVIIVSARNADEDMVLGLGMGADEFVTKPFSPRVLCARVDALLRRSRLGGLVDNTIEAGPFLIDPDAYFLKKDDRRITLSTREFELFLFLVKSKGKAFTPEELYDGIWRNAYGDLTAVGVYIQRIRRKIEEDAANPKYIRTVRGKGYLFCDGGGENGG
jgi:two-component system response regulator RegX3